MSPSRPSRPATDQAAASDQLQAMYEALPYPARDPEDERKRLVRTGLDFLPKISHYCHDGRWNADQPWRALVAGGGTGDSLIFLAEQLRGSPSELVYLDFSKASLEIARRRAEIRGFDHVSFVHASILNVDELGLEPFDYINCSGVLHHLPDPLDGLIKLRELLTPTGALGLMVYARYGRTAVYQVQALMRLLAGTADQATQITLTKKMLDALPDSNWFKRSPDLHSDHLQHGDAGLADLFLNPIDRAYSIPELYAWLAAADLHLIEFADHKLAYDPALYVTDPTLLRAIQQKDRIEQQAIAELMSGAIIKHTFYAAPQPRRPARLDDQTVPVAAFELDMPKLVQTISQAARGTSVALEKPGARLNLPVNPISVGFFQHLADGRTVSELASILQQSPALRAASGAWVKDQVLALCELLARAEFIYYRNDNHYR